MSIKISELTAADALIGTEEVPLTQSGSTKKVTINDLLPVQLQGDKIIDSNGKVLTITQGGVPLLSIDPTVGAQAAIIQAYDPTGEGSSASVILNSNPTLSRSELWADFNDGEKRVTIVAEAQASGGAITYTADNHIFPDVVVKDFADDTAAAVGLVPVGGLYHTSGTVKIRLT